MLNFVLQVFPRIKKNEALAHHGTEFPLGEEHQTMNKCSLHRRFVVANYLHVSFEVVDGQFFSIVSPTEVRVWNNLVKYYSAFSNYVPPFIEFFRQLLTSKCMSVMHGKVAHI